MASKSVRRLRSSLPSNGCRCYFLGNSGGNLGMGGAWWMTSLRSLTERIWLLNGAWRPTVSCWETQPQGQRGAEREQILDQLNKHIQILLSIQSTVWETLYRKDCLQVFIGYVSEMCQKYPVIFGQVSSNCKVYIQERARVTLCALKWLSYPNTSYPPMSLIIRKQMCFPWLKQNTQG